jgi:carboxyl-terminal processing protease
MRRRTLLAVAVTALLGAALVVQAQLSRDFTQEFLATPTGRALVQTYGALKSGYLTDIDDDVVIRGAIQGMLDALEDPYTYYREPRSASIDAQDRTGSFEGIGVSLTTHNRVTGRGVEVLNVYHDGPAHAAGVLRGDIFLEVDGIDVSTSTTTDIVDLVRGPRGTTVRISFQRPGEPEPVVLDIVRDTIELIEVSTALIDGDIGYLALRSFGNQRVHEQLVDGLTRLQLDGATSFVLDLRDNGGGLLTQGILVADEFLASGDIVFQRARGVTQRLAEADGAGIVDRGADGGAREPPVGVGLRDRRRRPAGERPRHRGRRTDVREGRGPERDLARRRRAAGVHVVRVAHPRTPQHQRRGHPARHRGA